MIFPFLIYQTIFLPIALWDHRQIIFDNSEWIKFLIGFIGGDGYNTPVSYYICLPCWFIVCIIQLRLLFLFVDINEFTTCFLIIFSVAFLTIRNVKQWDLFFCIDSTIDAIPYFLLGYYMKSKNVLEQHNTNIKDKLILVFAFAILIYLFLHENGASQMNRPSSGRIVIIDYVAGFVGSFMVFYLSQVLATIFGGKEWIKRISRNTLFIIFSHFLLLLPVGRLLRSVLKCENSFLSIVCALCVSLVVLFVSMLMINKWQEKFPVLFGKYK